MFLVSSFFWKLVIKSYEFTEVMTDSLSIIGIYYLLTSFIFLFFEKAKNKKINS